MGKENNYQNLFNFSELIFKFLIKSIKNISKFRDVLIIDLYSKYMIIGRLNLENCYIFILLLN